LYHLRLFVRSCLPHYLRSDYFGNPLPRLISVQHPRLFPHTGPLLFVDTPFWLYHTVPLPATGFYHYRYRCLLGFYRVVYTAHTVTERLYRIAAFTFIAVLFCDAACLPPPVWALVCRVSTYPVAVPPGLDYPQHHYPEPAPAPTYLPHNVVHFDFTLPYTVSGFTFAIACIYPARLPQHTVAVPYRLNRVLHVTTYRTVPFDYRSHTYAVLPAGYLPALAAPCRFITAAEHFPVCLPVVWIATRFTCGRMPDYPRFWTDTPVTATRFPA